MGSPIMGRRIGKRLVNRTSHDQLMKQALQDRFADFLRLFDPDRAGGLDMDTGVTFRNAETATDLPQGELLIPDIVASWPRSTCWRAHRGSSCMSRCSASGRTRT